MSSVYNHVDYLHQKTYTSRYDIRGHYWSDNFDVIGAGFSLFEVIPRSELLRTFLKYIRDLSG